MQKKRATVLEGYFEQIKIDIPADIHQRTEAINKEFRQFQVGCSGGCSGAAPATPPSRCRPSPPSVNLP